MMNSDHYPFQLTFSAIVSGSGKTGINLSLIGGGRVLDPHPCQQLVCIKLVALNRQPLKLLLDN